MLSTISRIGTGWSAVWCWHCDLPVIIDKPFCLYGLFFFICLMREFGLVILQVSSSWDAVHFTILVLFWLFLLKMYVSFVLALKLLPCFHGTHQWVEWNTDKNKSWTDNIDFSGQKAFHDPIYKISYHKRSLILPK